MKTTGRFAAIAAAGVLAMQAGSPTALAAPPQRHAVIVGINDGDEAFWKTIWCPLITRKCRWSS